MGVYNGTGYFVSSEALETIKMDVLEEKYPKIRQHLLRGQTPDNISAVQDLLSLLRLSGIATSEKILQYDEPVTFVGEFKKILDENEVDPDSGDAEMIDKLKNEEGYDYAVSHETEMTHTLEMITAILKEFNLITEHDVLETYWFLMPFEN